MNPLIAKIEKMETANLILGQQHNDDAARIKRLYEEIKLLEGRIVELTEPPPVPGEGHLPDWTPIGKDTPVQEVGVFMGRARPLDVRSDDATAAFESSERQREFVPPVTIGLTMGKVI